MDLSQNWIPEKVKTIHLIAVCGTGMGALACMLQDLGYQVTGSDQKVYPPMSDFLAQKGVAVCNGFQPENIAYGPDLVVVGNAVPAENPEAKNERDGTELLLHAPGAESFCGCQQKNTAGDRHPWKNHDCFNHSLAADGRRL